MARFPSTRTLLTGGVVGPVLFVVVFTILGAIRPGYDPMRQFVSLLMLSDGGWVQVASFLVSGALIAGSAIGLRRVLTPGPGCRLAPIGVGLAGLGLVVAGIFPTDPLQGYPPGTPPGLPLIPSWHAVLHLVGALLFFGGVPFASIVLARRFISAGAVGWAIYSAVSGIGMFLINAATGASPGTAGMFPDVAGLLQRISIVLGLAWLALLSLDFIRELTVATEAAEAPVV
jgi:Protein of unknown function (DUF998)